MKSLNIKNIAVASAFVAGNLVGGLANATVINYLDGQGYGVDSNNASVATGTYQTGGSITLSPTQTTWLRFPGRDFVNNTATYMSPLAAGTYTFSFNYSGTPANFIPYFSGCGVSPACPTSGLVVYYFTSSGGVGLTTSTTAVASSNSFTFTLASSTAIRLSISNWSTSGTYTFSNLLLTDGTVVQVVTPSVDLAPNAYALRSVYNIQSAALNAGLSYDCTVFDKEGLCLSTGGRYSTTNSPNATSTSGLLIGSYKYDKNIRLGAWVDQNLSTNNADGVKLGNSKPMLGVFGVWSERNDGLGYEVKVSAGYGEKDLTVTRSTSNEGSAKVNTKGIQSVSSYGIALDADWIAAPYAGLKYVSISRGGYTEGGSSALTYNNLRQETTSAVAGVKFTGKIDPQTFTVLSAGVEHDLNHNVGQYSAGSSNTTAFNSDVKKTRPVVSAGVYYDIDKTQRVGLNATHRQEAFQSTATTSALATYTVGF